MLYEKQGSSFSIIGAITEIAGHLTSWLFLGLYHAYVSHDIRFLFSCDVSKKLPRSTRLPHPIGIVIGEDVEIGEHVRIYHNVTIGRKDKSTPEYPRIEDHVDINSGALVAGDITVGSNATIAANAVVLKDVPEGAVAIGAPAEIIKPDI